MASTPYDFAASAPYHAVAFLAIAAYSLYRWLLPKPLPGIAYNAKAVRSLFGDGPDMLQEISLTHEFGVWCADQVERLGAPICQVFVRPFAKPWILVSDFRESQDILTRRTKEFDKSSFITNAMASLGDFHPRFLTNQKFKASRGWLQDLMTPSFLHGHMGPIIYSKGLELIQLFERRMELAAGRPFTVRDDYDFASLDAMMGWAFGSNLGYTAVGPQVELAANLDPSEIPQGGLDDPIIFPPAKLHDFLVTAHEVPQVVERTVIAWVPSLSLFWWRRMSWFKKLFSEKQRTVKSQLEIAKEHYEAGEIKSGLEHMLMREASAAEKEGRQPDFDNHLISDEIFGEIIAGHHTTGGAMGWLTKFLTGHPDVQSQVRSELYATFPQALEEDRLPSFDEIRKARLPYLDAAFEEMLRLTSVTVTREALCDTQILGRRVPKGSQVFLVSNGPGFLSPSLPINDSDRSPTARAAAEKSWDETQDLRLYEPDRWLVKKEDGSVEFDPNAGPQLGFGLGARSCWGRRMAAMEVKTILSMLIWHFEMLEIPAALSGYAGFDGVSRRPQKCFVRLRRARA
ncbi:hypothetical protein PFICI_00490 [Pestalotiopsis fici W106-1]|uniref:Cytochrome P450 n=1 Tax=Pestalotiopsis fici (strain W106-1 / CGMCC3.15140) TaxID=1229662 RepID=W3XME7_PESFW|nr:uncharacterized protein PFICI_00490 [Pestalotiopsis fici W106-1]ETS86662.1 hypothetical protein PFICI_00490 [Pestalotiopsis fici W106-1]